MRPDKPTGWLTGQRGPGQPIILLYPSQYAVHTYQFRQVVMIHALVELVDLQLLDGQLGARLRESDRSVQVIPSCGPFAKYSN